MARLPKVADRVVVSCDQRRPLLSVEKDREFLVTFHAYYSLHKFRDIGHRIIYCQLDDTFPRRRFAFHRE